MRHILLIALILVSIASYSQDRTLNPDAFNTHFEKGDKPEILLVSFNNKMYRSDVDRELGTHNDMSQPQLQAFFQKALTTKIVNEFSGFYKVNTLDAIETDSAHQILSFIYDNLKYEYEHIDKKGQKEKSEAEGVIKGQVVSRTEETEKFMNAYIQNDTLLSYLKGIRNFEYLILINEFDVTYSVDNPQMTAYGGIRKKFKAHYTIYGSEGKMITCGAREGFIPNEEKDIYMISENALPDLAKQIAEEFALKLEKNKD